MFGLRAVADASFFLGVISTKGLPYYRGTAAFFRLPRTFLPLSGPMLALSLLPPLSHSRWGCPPPRSSSTGIKRGFPCGEQTGDFSGTPIVIRPGPFTVRLEESIAHRGSGWRISLSGESNDTEACVLLDHIPHDDTARTAMPPLVAQRKFHQLLLTINIPDVSCERCSLHLANPMTDKIGVRGAPDGEGCLEPGDCPKYYSCTTPLTVLGKTPRAQHVCAGGFPEGWPQAWRGDGGARVASAEPGVYRRESAYWGPSQAARLAWTDRVGADTVDQEVPNVLLGVGIGPNISEGEEVPVKFRQMAGDLCVDPAGPRPQAAANGDALRHAPQHAPQRAELAAVNPRGGGRGGGGGGAVGAATVSVGAAVAGSSVGVVFVGAVLFLWWRRSALRAVRVVRRKSAREATLEC